MKDSFLRSLRTTVIFLLVGGIMALALGGYLGTASSRFTGGLVELQTWFATRYVGLQEFFSAPRDVASLRVRNAELEAEVALLQTQVIALEERAADAEILAALVDFSTSNPESSYKAASVIGRDPSPFLHYVIINLGSNDGIQRGMPVVTAQGLIGRVDAVIADAARVQLITDPASAINIRLQTSNVEAVLTGSVTGDLSLDLIPQVASIQEGDIVVTSGLGGGYPPDLIIGQVVNIRQRDADLFQQASVQPVVDFSRLSIVLVITNFRPINIEPLLPPTIP